MISTNKTKRRGFWVRFFFLIFIAGVFFWLIFPFINPNEEQSYSERTGTSITQIPDSLDKTADFLKAVLSSEDTNVHIIRVSKISDLKVPYEIDKDAGKKIKRIFAGRRINIAVIGVDSRLGSRYKHADANHILSFLIDKGKIEIISIPRDTYADAGFDDTTGQNKLTIVRAAKGRKTYLKEAAYIAGLDKIHYYIELGFSQAIGILKLFGFKKAGSMLQVLRSRTGLGGDDYQRTYNQAQFIRQMILRHFSKMAGFWGSILLRGSLAFVETDLSYSTANNIIDKLKDKSFANSPSDIKIKIKPAIPIKFKVYDFTNKEVLRRLQAKIEQYNIKHIAQKDSSSKRDISSKVAARLLSAINKAILDSAKRPTLVINRLKTYFDQRAWWQVEDSVQRSKIRDQFDILLSNAYIKKKKYIEAERIIQIIEDEKRLYSYPSNVVPNKDPSAEGSSKTF